MKKILALESLRGLAALIVVFCHIASGFYPAMVIGPVAAKSHSSFEKFVLSTPLNMFINGSFAVTCFFVLSGFVLSYGYFSRSTDLVAASIKRYFRLVPVVFVSVIISFFIMKLDLYRNVDAATVSQSEWLGQFWRVDFNMLDALWCGFIGVFIAPSPASSLNPVLWTIYYELVGSLIVYSLLALVGRDSRRIIMYIIMMIVLINTNYAGFITGVVLCDLYVNKNVIYKNISLFKRVYKFVLLVIAVILASYPAYISNASDFSLLYRIMSELPELNITKNIIYLVASMLFIVLILTSIKFQTLLEVKPIIFLGKISYSMYAVHLIILGVVASAVFVYFDSFMPYNYAVLSMMPIYLVSVFLTSTLLSIYVDKPSIYLSKLISNKLSLKR